MDLLLHVGSNTYFAKGPILQVLKLLVFGVFWGGPKGVILS